VSAGYRVRLRAEIAAIADDGDDAAMRVGQTLTALLRADLAPTQIVPALNAAISSETSAHAQRLLDRARLAVIGGPHINRVADDH